MFKNPLKYASGGTMLPSEQQAENDFISVIAEGLGAQPEQVKARLEQIKSNPTESQQLQEALQLMQQDKNKGFQAVLSLFAGKPQSAKRGGKIQDFICKHAKGGVAGCGCEKPVEKHQQENGKGRGIIGALSGLYNRFVGQSMPDVSGVNNRRVRTWTDANGIQHIVEDANVNGNSTVTTIDINGADTLGTQKITTGDGRYRMVNLQPGTPQWRSVMSRNVPQQENGGKVEKAQDGTKMSLFTNILKRIPPRIQSNKPLNPSNSWRFIVENFDKEHPDSSIVIPGIGGPLVLTRTYDQFGMPHTATNVDNIQPEPSKFFDIIRNSEKIVRGNNSWGQPNTIYNIK